MSNKRESTFVNMFLTLLLIGCLSGGALAGVYLLTKDKIAAVAKEKSEAALREVLPPFDRVEDQNIPVLFEGVNEELPCFVAYQGDKFVGVAVNSYTKKAYSGEFSIMVGLLLDGTINKVAVLKHAETPGLGAKIESIDFLKQFEGKNPQSFRLQVKKDGGDVDAISAATISSRAFCNAIDRAEQVLTTLEEGGRNE